ncbi:MAG: hypothetical protein P8123_06135 [bacterium]
MGGRGGLRHYPIGFFLFRAKNPPRNHLGLFRLRLQAQILFIVSDRLFLIGAVVIVDNAEIQVRRREIRIEMERLLVAFDRGLEIPVPILARAKPVLLKGALVHLRLAGIVRPATGEQ